MSANISDYGKVSASTGTDAVSSATTSDASLKTGYTNKDTINKATEAVVASGLLSPNFPILTPPVVDETQTANMTSLTNGSLALNINQQQANTVTNMLQSWNDNIAEQKKLSVEWYNSPQHQEELRRNSPQGLASSEFQSTVKIGIDPTAPFNNVIPTDPVQKTQQQEETLRVGLANGIENWKQSINSGTAKDIAFVAPALVLGSTMLSVAANPQVNFFASTFDSFVKSVSTVPAMVPASYATLAGMIGSVFAIGTINHAELKNTVDSVKNGVPHDDSNLARNYASKVNQLSQSGVLKNFILGSTVDKLPGAEKMNESQKSDLASFVQIVLLSTSVGALYKSDTKWITGQEFMDTIDGKLQITANNESQAKNKALIEQSVSQINSLLNNMSPTARDKMRSALKEYMDSNPKYESFFDIQSAINSVAQTTPFQEPKA